MPEPPGETLEPPVPSEAGVVRTPALVLEGGPPVADAFGSVGITITTPALILESEWVFAPLTISTPTLVLESSP
jgi:hypothetical protein